MSDALNHMLADTLPNTKWPGPLRAGVNKMLSSFTVYGSVEIDMWQLLVFYGGFITVSVWAFGLESLIPASCWAYLLSWVYFIYLVWTESLWWVDTILCLCTWFANAASVAKLAGIPCIIFCPYSCSFININIDEGMLDLCFACKAR